MSFFYFKFHPSGIAHHTEHIARHSHYVALPKQRLERIGHIPQRRIAFIKAEPLVKRLEVVQIEHDKRITFFQISIKQILHVIRKQKRIRESRQFIVVACNFGLLRQANRPKDELYCNRKRKPEKPCHKHKVIQEFRCHLDHAHAHIHGEVYEQAKKRNKPQKTETRKNLRIADK